MIKPTIGRRVWYYPSGFDRGLTGAVFAPDTVIASDGKQPCDAGICYVHGDRLVNLTIADHDGKMHRRCGVELLQPGDTEPEDGRPFCTWMPYQVANAK